MTVPKSRETSAVYICRNTGNEGTIFIHSKTENECSILYAPRRGMRACNNDNMRNPSLNLYGVTHVIRQSPFPVLLHIYTALVSLLFGTIIPTSFNILMEMFFLPLYIGTRTVNI